jgi:hypothetical protein
MESFIEFAQHHHSALMMLALAWITFVVLASVVVRLRNGKSLVPRRPHGALYFERTASGHSNRNVVTRLGGARNCLQVAVTADELRIVPMVPFNLMFMPEIFDLEHSIRLGDVREVSVHSSRRVTVAWQVPGADFRSAELFLKDPNAFAASMRRG